MPPAFLYDISTIDLNQRLFGQEAIRERNLQRGDMEHLNAIIWADPANGRIVGVKDVRDNEFWVPGHVPGRPLLPGVIMVESAAQLASFYARTYMGWEGFIGFGGVEKCRFRQQVPPGNTLYLVGQLTGERHRMLFCDVQGLVNGNICFECSIIGTKM